MKHWKLLALFVILALLVTAVTGCQKKSTKLIVGTSADYPPFEFMNDQNQFDGFDVKLMEEIARRLNYEIEWQDIAFDGLIGSLQTGKIDLIIAAMSATPERAQQVAFTDPYYIGKDAVLVADGSTLTIGAKEDLAGKIVGVQTGTIQDSWVTDNLADTEIRRYERAEQAVQDLKSGRIEVVALDYFAASAFLKQGGVKLALETNFSDEHMSIAAPLGSTELLADLNRVIRELQAEGFIDKLGEQYLAEQ